jgi:hypothetical protein
MSVHITQLSPVRSEHFPNDQGPTEYNAWALVHHDIRPDSVFYVALMPLASVMSAIYLFLCDLDFVLENSMSLTKSNGQDTDNLRILFFAKSMCPYYKMSDVTIMIIGCRCIYI